MKKCDVLIVGAGPVGSVAARLLAEKNFHCVILEKRNHLAGNCYDRTDSHGVLIHQYGPHYFRTNKKTLVTWLSRFTDWVEGTYIVKSQVGDRLYPFPINLETLEMVFGRAFEPRSAEKFIKGLQLKLDAPPKNSKEFVLSRVGTELYEKFYHTYSLKQWELDPEQLGPEVCGRIPVRFDRNDRYVDHKFQVMPRNGFTQMFKNMIGHPKIEVKLDTNFLEDRQIYQPSVATIYTGPIDQYFNNQFGKLPWRSLDFDFRSFDEEFIQPCVQINYPDLAIPFTRSVEIKHATGQKLPTTTVSYEYPKSKGDPFYPVPNDENKKLFLKYKKLAALETENNNIHFAGRLAEYTYINTDEAIERGFAVAEKIIAKKSSAKPSKGARGK